MTMDPLFGSEVRGRVLAQMASTPFPQSAYRVARSVGAEPIQVLRILKSLEGITEHTPQGWVLSDHLLRRFLKERQRREEDRTRVEKDAILIQNRMKPSRGHERGHARRTRRAGARAAH